METAPQQGEACIDFNKNLAIYYYAFSVTRCLTNGTSRGIIVADSLQHSDFILLKAVVHGKPVQRNISEDEENVDGSNLAS